MKTLFHNLLGILAALITFSFFAPAASAECADGPEVFKTQGCTKCHSATKAGIQRAPDKSEDAKDLSTVGARYDKKAIAQYLLKKTAIDGEKHKASFGGTTAELKLVAEWLETLK